jgi:hypothetical protein
MSVLSQLVIRNEVFEFSNALITQPIVCLHQTVPALSMALMTEQLDYHHNGATFCRLFFPNLLLLLAMPIQGSRNIEIKLPLKTICPLKLPDSRNLHLHLLS